MICYFFGNGFGERFSLRISLLLVLVGLSGLCVEIINGFEYMQGARKEFQICFKNHRSSCCDRRVDKFKFQLSQRLTLIASDPRISAVLLLLSMTKLILIYLNYRLWSMKLKVMYGKFLDTFILERK